ncbi:MAG: hypothetical protein K8R59_00385 [Thermoanaerobaculales bacterium]|nr:hypothetical protein [Thermoanaerobaculales bacterium]
MPNSKDLQQDTPSTLPDLLSFHVGNQSTGTFTSHSTDAERKIILVGGEVRAARSSLEKEKLGCWLVHNAHITENDRAHALLSQGREDAPPLGFILVNQNILTRETLELELQELALTIIRRAAEDPNARSKFSESTQSDELDTLAQLTTTQILLTAARAFPDLEQKRKTLGDLTQVVIPANDLVALIEGLSLTPTEAFLLSRLEGARSLTSLFQVSSLPEDQTISTIYSLVTASLLKIGPALHPTPIEKPFGRTTSVNLPVVNEELLSDRHLEERKTVRRLAEHASRADHYEALGLKLGSPSVEILDAWNTIREQYGSERTNEYHLSDSGPLLDTIRERAHDAYQVLGNSTSRNRYDTVLTQIEKDQRRLNGRPSKVDADARSLMVKANIQRANELIREGETHLAIQLLEQACAFDPRPNELVKLAKLLVRNPMWDNRALKYLRQAIEIDSRCVDAWIETAEYWRRHRDPERQRKSLERALTIDPDNERANRMYKQLAGAGPLKRVLHLARFTRR